jgi:hypothetical protein
LPVASASMSSHVIWCGLYVRRLRMCMPQCLTHRDAHSEAPLRVLVADSRPSIAHHSRV